MKRLKKALSFLLVGALTVTSLFCGAVTASAANAKDIVAKALKIMKDSTSISYSYEHIVNYTVDNYSGTQYRHGIHSSDSNINYGIYIDLTQPEKAWTQYDYNDHIYRKGYNDSSYQFFYEYNYNKDRRTGKKALEHTLSHLKNIKITNTSEKYYIITGKPNWKDSGSKKITLTISIKTGRLVKCVYAMAKKTYNTIDPKDTYTYTVTGGATTLSNICYGDMALSLPDELKGR